MSKADASSKSTKPRRSLRSRKESSYAVGDIVEITHRSRKGRGRLLYCLTQDNASPNPLWLVTFQHSDVIHASTKDLEIHEHSFGRILSNQDAATGVDNSTTPSKDPSRGIPKIASSSAGSHSSSEAVAAAAPKTVVTDKITTAISMKKQSGGKHNRVSTKKRNIVADEVSNEDGMPSSTRVSRRGGYRRGGNPKNASLSPEKKQQQQNPGEDRVPSAEHASSTLKSFPTSLSASTENPNTTMLKKDKAATARAQRSLRRQAMMEDTPSSSNDKSNGGGSGGRNVKRETKNKRVVSNSYGSNGNNGSGSNHNKKSKVDKDEEVIKVKLNTGTLYLYRGLHRRAVFVRRY